MIARALRIDIESYAIKMRDTNPLYTRARDGSMTRAAIMRYLVNLRHAIRRTMTNLDNAAKRSRAIGDAKLAAFFTAKRSEEVGHDAWADSDIQQVSLAQKLEPRAETSLAMNELLAYAERVIEADPTLYLSYLLFAEYITVLLGGDWLVLLEERCGIPTSSMTVVDKHVELDRHHVEAALDTIDELVGDPRKLPEMRATLAEVIAYFDRFCIEVTSGADVDVERVSAA